MDTLLWIHVNFDLRLSRLVWEFLQSAMKTFQQMIHLFGMQTWWLSRQGVFGDWWPLKDPFLFLVKNKKLKLTYETFGQCKKTQEILLKLGSWGESTPECQRGMRGGPNQTTWDRGVHSADSLPFFRLLDSPMEDIQSRLQISVENMQRATPRPFWKESLKVKFSPKHLKNALRNNGLVCQGLVYRSLKYCPEL